GHGSRDAGSALQDAGAREPRHVVSGDKDAPDAAVHLRQVAQEADSGADALGGVIRLPAVLCYKEAGRFGVGAPPRPWPINLGERLRGSWIINVSTRTSSRTAAKKSCHWLDTRSGTTSCRGVWAAGMSPRT